MKKENLQKAKELSSTQSNLKLLKDMVKDNWFGIGKKIKFKDYYSIIEINEFDRTTQEELCATISNFCDKKIADIDKEIEDL